MTDETAPPKPDDVDTEPKGCLGCNREVVEPRLASFGITADRFVEVPRPRHAWADVICCALCGRAWLVKPKAG